MGDRAVHPHRGIPLRRIPIVWVGAVLLLAGSTLGLILLLSAALG